MKYRFTISCASPNLMKVTDFLRKCDVIKGILLEKYIVEYESTSDYIDMAPIKSALKEGWESMGFVVHKIEGGKSE